MNSQPVMVTSLQAARLVFMTMNLGFINFESSSCVYIKREQKPWESVLVIK